MPKGKGYGSPSSKIGKTGNLTQTKGKGGSHSFLPNQAKEGVLGNFGNNKDSKTSASSSTTKMPFLPSKPE